jgi:hypothetical protein
VSWVNLVTALLLKLERIDCWDRPLETLESRWELRLLNQQINYSLTNITIWKS